MKVTFYGHACFAVEIQGKSMVFDPFITDNPLASDIHLHDIPCDYLLLSHGHADHTADAMVLAKMKNPLLISSFEITEWASKQGYTHVHPMNIGGSHSLPIARIKMVQALHSSSFADGTYAGPASGFVVESQKGTFYYAGDTALTLDMQLIQNEFSLDFAILPIGDNFTMGVQDAIKAAKLIGCNTIIGMHYDTFGYIQINHREAIAAFAKEGITLHLLKVGSTLTF